MAGTPCGRSSTWRAAISTPNAHVFSLTSRESSVGARSGSGRSTFTKRCDVRGARCEVGNTRWEMRATSSSQSQPLAPFQFQLGVVLLVEPFELLEPLLVGVRRSEAPLLAVIVPVVGVERLRALEVGGGERGVAGLLNPHGELNVASASISVGERGFTRRANSSSDST